MFYWVCLQIFVYFFDRFIRILIGIMKIILWKCWIIWLRTIISYQYWNLWATLMLKIFYLSKKLLQVRDNKFGYMHTRKPDPSFGFWKAQLNFEYNGLHINWKFLFIFHQLHPMFDDFWNFEKKKPIKNDLG